jgi:dihydrofolate reductase
MSRVLENFPTIALRDFYLSPEFKLVHAVYKTGEIQDLVDRILALAGESAAVAILQGTGTYSYFWKEQLQKKGIFVLVAVSMDGEVYAPQSWRH